MTHQPGYDHLTCGRPHARAPKPLAAAARGLSSGMALACLLLLGACGGGEGNNVTLGSGQSSDPVVLDFPVFYVKRPVPDPMDAPSDSRELRTFQIGADLFMRDRASPKASERNLTAAVTQGLGDVGDVDVSYDGRKVVFSMRARFIEGADEEDQPTWNIWEHNLTTSVLRRVIASDTTAEEGHDRFPHYLPDGRIVFASTRQRQSKAILLDEGKPQYSAQDENNNEPAFVLHVMNADGSDIHQVTYNQSHDFDSSVLPNGQVVFSRWEGATGGDRISLYRMNPDGTALELLYGSRSHATGSGGSTIQFMSPRPMQNGRLLSLIRPFSDTDEGGDLISIDTANYVENTQPTLPNAGVLTGPAQTRITVTDVITIAGPSPGGRYRSAFPLWDGTNRVLVSWSQCRVTLNARVLPCTTANLADPAAVPAPPLYGVYIYDVGQNTQAPIVAPTEGTIYTDVVAAAARTAPSVIIDKTIDVDLDANLAGEGVGILHIKSVYDIDGVDTATGGLTAMRNPLTTPAAPRQAQFLRLEKPVSIPDDLTLDPDLLDQAFGPNRGLGLKDILGYIPIEPDGSVKARVPANVAFAISIVDGNGQRVGTRHQSWLQLRPGEVVTCGGCHNPATTPPRSHGRSNLFATVNTGAPADGLFPGTDTTLQANPGETMAETRGRVMCPISSALGGACSPSVNLIFNDLWTAPAPSKVASFDRCYTAATTDVRNNPADPTSRHLCTTRLDTALPVATQCSQTWSSLCRITINYVSHLQPIWNKSRPILDGMNMVIGDNVCTSCHGPTNAMAQAQLPAAQLDLTGGPSPDNPDQLNSYRELLFTDNEQELNAMGQLQDRLIQVINPNTGLPEFQTVPVAGPMSAGNARGSRFFSVFGAGGSHAGRLTAAELRLISEWVDIGAQYYNDPFAVPVN
jgi:Tol biopolymer transport system component